MLGGLLRDVPSISFCCKSILDWCQIRECLRKRVTDWRLQDWFLDRFWMCLCVPEEKNRLSHLQLVLFTVLAMTSTACEAEVRWRIMPVRLLRNIHFCEWIATVHRLLSKLGALLLPLNTRRSTTGTWCDDRKLCETFSQRMFRKCIIFVKISWCNFIRSWLVYAV